MNIKALVTMLILGSSSAAMAQPMAYSGSARASISIGTRPRPMPLPRPVFVQPTVTVRDHRHDVPTSYPTSYPNSYTNSYTTSYNDNYSHDDSYDDSCDQVESLTGTYKSMYGDVRLVQNGNRVHATYVSHNGTIDGIIDGNVIRFRWTQPDGRGTGVWTISRSGRLEGTWGNGRSNLDGGRWDLSPAAV